MALRAALRGGLFDCASQVALRSCSNLKDMAGFVEFHMLKGPEVDGQIIYASHTVWASEDAFRGGVSKTAP